MVEGSRERVRSPSGQSLSPRAARSSSRGLKAKSLKNDDSNKKIKGSKNSRAIETGGRKKGEESTDWLSYSLFGILVFITVFYYPKTEEVNTSYVFYHGWITAISTGLGVLPFYFVTDPSKFVMGVSNAIAGGMMIAASYSLSYEGTSICVYVCVCMYVHVCVCVCMYVCVCVLYMCAYMYEETRTRVILPFLWWFGYA